MTVAVVRSGPWHACMAKPYIQKDRATTNTLTGLAHGDGGAVYLQPARQTCSVGLTLRHVNLFATFSIWQTIQINKVAE
jgi:hypothetical protein